MELNEQFILLQAPNPAASGEWAEAVQKGKLLRPQENRGRHFVLGGVLRQRQEPLPGVYRLDRPRCAGVRCSCPSRQFPCKHALGLMFEQLSGKIFEPSEIPQDVAEKRAKQAAREAKKADAEADTAKPKKTNTAAQKKKLARQLEGLDMAEKMVNDLLSSGLGSLGGTTAQTFDKLAKDLGSSYLTGPQTAFTRIALLVRTVQKDPAQAEGAYAEALRILIALHSTIKKSRVFLQSKLDAGSFTPEDSALFEALGGVWKLEDLQAIGSVQENARLVQLSFDVSFDEAKKEYIERGWWLDLDHGKLYQSLNLRPLKALKYVKGDDSRFGLLEIPSLYIYPGEGDRRVRWESASTRPLTAEEHARLVSLAQPSLAAAVKQTKGSIKNTLAPKFLAVLVPVGKLGRVGDTFVLEDPAGDRIVLRDRPEDGPDHASTARLAMLPGELPAGSTLFGLMFYSEGDHSLCLHPYSVVTPDAIIRLQY